MNLEPEQYQGILAKSQQDPAWFVRNILGDEPWELQVKIMESVRDNKETAVRSCHSAGKSWLASRIGLWFGATHPGSIVITTAPTERQVRGIIWKEIRSAHARSRIPLGGTPLTQELRWDADWYMQGFTAPDYDSDKFQGWHAPYLLIITDEACGISMEIFDAISSCISGGIIPRLLMIGNPTDGSTQFARSFQDENVTKFKIPAYDTPNFTKFGIKEKHIADGSWRDLVGDKPLPAPHLVSPEWVEKRYKMGPDSPFYISRVLAEFPDVSKHTLIPLRWVEAAQERELVAHAHDVELGVDVARYGSDETTIAKKNGPIGRIVTSYRGVNTMETVGRVAAVIAQENATTTKVDVIGVGAGVVDRLSELGLPVIEGNGSRAAKDSNKFLNARAEWYWHLRELFEDGQIDIDPEDEDLAQQLSNIQYKFTSTGKIVIESKDDMAKRGFSSPDRADALCYAFAPMDDNEVIVIF